MSKNNHLRTLGLSYYRLSLLSYLKEAHPLFCDDLNFIKQRAEAAAEVYSITIKSGLSHPEAESAAIEELYRGLHFSSFNTLVKVLWEEFPKVVPEEEARETALRLYPQCLGITTKYATSDNFANTKAYEYLYIELTGAMQILLDDNGEL